MLWYMLFVVQLAVVLEVELFALEDDRHDLCER